MIICVDFDGTLAAHRYPAIGPAVPGAIEWCQMLMSAGCRLVLFTMRSGKQLDEAVQWCADKGIELFGVNVNPEQHSWTQSPKAYGNVYVDDNAVGCPLIDDPTCPERRMVDWNRVGEELMYRLRNDT